MTSDFLNLAYWW